MTRRSMAGAYGAIVAALVTASGCGRLVAPTLVPIHPLVRVPAFSRVLVAGFVSVPVSGVDANEETAWLLRRELRSQLSLDVVNTEPLRLDPSALVDAPFWRRIGEEYREPLIVTGVVEFKKAGHYYEERYVGRRTLRLWWPQYSLEVRLLVIDGHSGEEIGSADCGPTFGHAATGERVLTVYYRLIDRTMPSILGMFGRRMTERSPSGTPCRIDRVAL